MTENRVDVVISGAGPNGLMLACELALAGVRPVVLERLPAPSEEPKANGLVGQVIRLLDIRGLYSMFTGSDEPPKPMYDWIFSGMRVPLFGMQDNPLYGMPIQQPRLVRLFLRTGGRTRRRRAVGPRVDRRADLDRRRHRRCVVSRRRLRDRDDVSGRRRRRAKHGA